MQTWRKPLFLNGPFRRFCFTASLVLYAALTPCIVFAQVPRMADIPDGLPTLLHQRLTQTAESLRSRRSQLVKQAGDHNTKCNAVLENTPEWQNCSEEQTNLQAERRQYIDAVNRFNDEVAKAVSEQGSQADTTPKGLPPPSPPARTYTPSGNALIGGTTWITGYNVRNADPNLIAKEREMMAQQMKLAGMQYSDGVDFNRYNFVLGIAASTDAFTDLSSRVIFDEFSKGQFSAAEQAAYDSLKGRQFGELACHSNGAMVCLAALKNKDIVADHVVLYGPQVTVESLKMWDDMVRSGQMKSVKVYINRSDPVPPASLIAGGGLVGATALSSLAMFKPPTITRAINEISPRLTVQTFACGNGLPTLDCHAMTAYKARVSFKPPPPLQSVPGTKLNGVGVPEPPSPH